MGQIQILATALVALLGVAFPGYAWEGVNWGLFSGDDDAMKTLVGRIVEHMERLECKTLLLPE